MALFSALPLGTLVYTTTDAILQVFLLCLAGYFLTRLGIIDSDTKLRLNKINVSLFTPALFFSKVAFSLSPEKLGELYVVPVGFIIITLVSAFTAWVLASLFRLRRSQKAFAIACAMNANSNTLPVALMQSLAATLPALKWGDHDNKDQILGRALTYLVLFSTLGMILRWSVGMKLLGTADEESSTLSRTSTIDDSLDEEEEDEIDDEEPLLGTGISYTKRHNTSTVIRPHRDTDQSSDHTLATSARYKSSGSLPSTSFPSSPCMTAPVSPDGPYGVSRYQTNETYFDREVDEDDQNDDQEWGSLGGSGRKDRSASSRLGTKLLKSWTMVHSFLEKVRSFMTVPLYASILSIVVALIPPVQKALHKVTFLTGALKNAGNVSVPLTLVVLGAYFYNPPSPIKEYDNNLNNANNTSSNDDRGISRPTSMYFGLPMPATSAIKNFGRIFRDSSTDIKNRPIRNRHSQRNRNNASHNSEKSGERATIFVAIFSRMILTPAILLPLLYLFAIKTYNVADDPVFVVTSALIIGSPPAITLAQITSACGPQFERLISKTLLYSYAIVTPPMTIILVIFGLLIDKRQRETGFN